MISNELLAEAEELSKAIAPELFDDGGRVYFVDQKTLADLPYSESCFAYVLTGGGAMMLDVIERIPDWTQPGPIVSFVPERIAETFGLGDDFRDAFLNIVCHEIGHCLPTIEYPDRLRFDTVTEAVDAPELRELQREKLAVSAKQVTQFDLHGKDFVRRAIHLWYRARVNGWEFSDNCLLAGCVVGVPTWRFAETLIHECDQLRDATFDEIEAAEPPKSFCRKWDYLVSIFSCPDEGDCDANP